MTIPFVIVEMLNGYRQGSENVGQNRSTSHLYQLFDDNEQVKEPCHEKTGFLHMRKQRRRSASR